MHLASNSAKCVIKTCLWTPKHGITFELWKCFQAPQSILKCLSWNHQTSITIFINLMTVDRALSVNSVRVYRRDLEFCYSLEYWWITPHNKREINLHIIPFGVHVKFSFYLSISYYTLKINHLLQDPINY